MLGAVLLLSGLLEFVRLSQNGFANVYYSAAVKSMLRSWHNFFFVSADPNGLIMVDKPPLGLWLQAVSAKVFGFSALSLLVPEGVCAVLAVWLLYRLVAPRWGVVAGLVGAFALAVFPAFVAVSRDNGVDPLLILLMLAGCGAALTAVDTGRLRWVVLSGLLVGLAFETKALAALLCVPGIAVALLVCGPGSLRRRVGQLAVGGLVLFVAAAAWPLAVDLTPASQRPFVGSTSANSETQLIFGYNGFGRVGGQQGGPDSTKKYAVAAQPPLIRPGVNTAPTPSERRYRITHARQIARERAEVRARARAALRARRLRERLPKPAYPTAHVVPFASTHLTPVRIFGKGLGDQAGWDVPLALLGLIAMVLAVRRRGDRRTAMLFVLGGWFVVELLTLDFSKGIVHPYYASALGPGLAAIIGAGAVALAGLIRSRSPRTAVTGYAIAVVAIAGTVGAQLFLIQRYGDPLWWRIPMVVICLGALVAIAFAGARSGFALGVAVAAVLVAPFAYSLSVWGHPVAGTFPTAGPHDAPGRGGYGVAPATVRTDRLLIRWLETHGATKPYQLLTQSSDQASPLILLGLRAGAMGGYNTTDPALSGAALADLVAAHRARYLFIGGPYSSRGGNGASTAARLVCPEVPQLFWANSEPGAGSFLVDCGGRSAELRHPYGVARAFLRAHPKVRYTL